MPLSPSSPPIPNTHHPLTGFVRCPDDYYSWWGYFVNDHWVTFDGTNVSHTDGMKAAYKLPDHILPALSVKPIGSFKFRGIEVEMDEAQVVIHHDKVLDVLDNNLYTYLPTISLSKPYKAKSHRLVYPTPKPFKTKLLLMSFDDHMVLACRVAACAAANLAGRKARIDDLRGLRQPTTIALDSVPLETLP